jgi:hypothetical protein
MPDQFENIASAVGLRRRFLLQTKRSFNGMREDNSTLGTDAAPYMPYLLNDDALIQW